MKKILAIASTALIVVSMLVACGPATKTTDCDFCGKENVKCKEIKVEGESGWFCDDCYEGVKVLADAAKKM